MDRSHKSNTVLLDLLFLMLLGIVAMFFLSWMMINPTKSKADIETKAEYVITVTWPKGCTDDVDTWLMNPLEQIVWYSNKEVGLMHLDRDDLGSSTDVLVLPDGRIVEYIYNQELTTIRGFIPGEWVLSIHMYSKKDSNPIEVLVAIDKLNPIVKRVFQKAFQMATHWEEITVARMEMTGNGDILKWDDLPKKMVKTTWGY